MIWSVVEANLTQTSFLNLPTDTVAFKFLPKPRTSVTSIQIHFQPFKIGHSPIRQTFELGKWSTNHYHTILLNLWCWFFSCDYMNFPNSKGVHSQLGLCRNLSCDFCLFVRNSRKYTNNSFHLVTLHTFPNLFSKFSIEML